MRTNYLYLMVLIEHKSTDEPTTVIQVAGLFQMLAQAISTQQARDLLDTIRVYVMSVNSVVGEEKMNELVTEFWPVQTEPGSVADQLLKKGEVRGEARGEARGQAKERVNTIRTLQSIVGSKQTSVEELSSQSLDELQAMIDSLQQQIASRLK